MTNVYDFDSFDRAQRLYRQSAGIQFGRGLEQNPDDIARSFALSHDTGVSASTIHDNLDQFDPELQAKLAQQIIEDDDAISGFINAHSLHAGLINDDLPNLKGVTSTFNKIYHRQVDPIAAGFKGFAEGFGDDAVGALYPEKLPGSSHALVSLLAPIGIPLELLMRGFSGVLEGAKQGAKSIAMTQGSSEQSSESFANDLAGMLEQQMMGVGVYKPVVGRPAVEINLPGVKEFATKEARTLEPFLRAGEAPPLGASELVDSARAEQAKQAQKGLDELITAVEATRLKERSPEKFAEFMDFLPKADVRISAEGLRRVYGEKLPEPGDGILGDVISADQLAGQEAIGGEVSVAAKDFLAQPNLAETYKALKDDIAVGENHSVNEIKELEAKPRQAIPDKAPPGFIRFFHGGPPEGGEPPTTGGGRWVNENYQYARDYRSVGERPGQVWYVDIPNEWLDEKFPDTQLYRPEGKLAGVSRQSYPSFEAPEQFAKQMVPYDPTALKTSGDPALDAMRRSGGLEPAREPSPAENLRSFYEQLKQEQGDFRTVSIGALIERSGLPAEEVKQALVQAAKRKEVTIHHTTSVEFAHDPLTKSGEIKLPGFEEPFVTVAFKAPREVEPPKGAEPPRVPPEEPPPPGEPPKEKPTGIFTKGKAFGRTEAMYRRYQELIAKRDAEDVARRQRLADKQAELENSEEWAAEADKIRAEVESEIRSRSDVAAHQFFSEGIYNGQKLKRRPKLQEDMLYEHQLEDLPTEFVAEKGLDPDDVGNLFGFSHGEGLTQAVSAVEREAAGYAGDIVKRLVDAEIYRRVNAKLGDTHAERLADAKDHALSLTQMEMLHEQTLLLGEGIEGALPLDKATMDAGAKKLLAEQRFGSLKSSRLLAMAGKAGMAVEKALLKNDALGAFKAAQQQYIIAQMTREAREVEKQTQRFEKDAKKFRKREVDGIEPEYTNWVHDILGRVGRTVNRSKEDLQTEINAQAQTTLKEFLDAKEDAGREIVVPDALIDPAYKKDIEDMTVAEAREVMDAVRSLIKNGRDERQVIVKGDRLDLKDFIAQAVEKLSELGEKKTPAELEQEVGAKIKNLGRTFFAGSLQVESILNRWDRGDAFGIFNYYVGRPLFEAANYKDALGKQFAKRILELDDKADLAKVIPNNIFRDPHSALRPTAEDPGAIDWDNARPLLVTRKNLRAVLLNAGNKDNLSRLARGYGLKPEQVMDWLNTYATERDWDWAQKFGDIFKDLKEISDRAARNRSGVAPEAIPLEPVEHPTFGKYDGWYWPVIHDAAWVGRIEKGGGDKLFRDDYVKAGTPQGYTKRRTNYRGPLSLDLDAVPSRLAQEIHDIAFRDAIIQGSKVFYDKSFRNAVAKYYGKVYDDLFIPWLKDIANSGNGNSAADATWSHWSEFFRQNVIGTLVGMNIRTVQKHTLSAAMNSITEVGGKEFLQATQSLLRNDMDSTKSNWEFAIDKSEELQRRSQNFVEQVTGAQEQVLEGRNWRKTILKAGTAPVAFFDQLSAVPTWLASYKSIIEAGKSEGDAIYAADRSVRRAHGSSAVTNRPELMRRQPWLASLYGFFNHIANRQYELAWQAKEVVEAAKAGDTAEAMRNAPHLGVGLFSYVIFPALVEELVTPMTTDEKESWAKMAAKGLVRGASSSWIGVRDLANAMLNAKDGTLGLGSAAAKEFTDLARDIANKNLGFDKAHAGRTLKHAVTAFGGLTGLTNAAEGNVAEYLYNLYTGKEREPNDLKALYRGITKGQSQPKSGPDIIERLLPGREVRRK